MDTILLGLQLLRQRMSVSVPVYYAILISYRFSFKHSGVAAAAELLIYFHPVLVLLSPTSRH